LLVCLTAGFLCCVYILSVVVGLVISTNAIACMERLIYKMTWAVLSYWARRCDSANCCSSIPIHSSSGGDQPDCIIAVADCYSLAFMMRFCSNDLYFEYCKPSRVCLIVL